MFMQHAWLEHPTVLIGVSLAILIVLLRVTRFRASMALAAALGTAFGFVAGLLAVETPQAQLSLITWGCILGLLAWRIVDNQRKRRGSDHPSGR